MESILGSTVLDVVDYKKSDGLIRMPEGFKELIKDRPLEEQIKRFRVTHNPKFWNVEWDRRRDDEDEFFRLETMGDLEAYIVHQGVIVGIVTRDIEGDMAPLMVESRLLVGMFPELDDTFTVPNNEREIYFYLLCVGDDF